MSTSTALKEYETIYILRPDVDADTADKLAQRLGDVIQRAQGRITKFESWGRRRLAYEVGKQRKGVYIFLKYLGKGGLVAELERNLRLADAVLKHHTVLAAENIDVAQVVIDPEEAKLARLDLPPEEDEKLTRERILGLVDGERREERKSAYEEDFESAEDIEGEDAEAEEAVPAPTE